MLTQTGATARERAMLYKAVVQTVLIYGSNSWVVMGEMLKVLEGFHHWVDIWIPGKTARRTVDGAWEWPPVADAMYIEGICTIKEYIKRRQAIIALHIDCRPIYKMYMGSENITGLSRFMRWWD